MKKALLQFIVIITFLVSLFLLVSQIDWLNLFQINKITDQTEQKLGDVIWNSIKINENEISNDFVLNSIDSLVSPICEKNNLQIEDLHIHVVQNDEINAFALPGNHLVIYTGLINESKNQQELLGVICHEIAHIKLQHVSKKLAKEFGLSILLSIVSGTGDSNTIAAIVKHLTSTSFDREYEKEADLKAVEVMMNTGIDVKPFADFLYRLSLEENNLMYSELISTHPDSKKRSIYILQRIKKYSPTKNNIISVKTWEKLKLNSTKK